MTDEQPHDSPSFETRTSNHEEYWCHGPPNFDGAGDLLLGRCGGDPRGVSRIFEQARLCGSQRDGEVVADRQVSRIGRRAPDFFLPVRFRTKNLSHLQLKYSREGSFLEDSQWTEGGLLLVQGCRIYAASPTRQRQRSAGVLLYLRACLESS